MKACPDCNGDGVIEKGTDDEQRCPTCGGIGFVPNNDDNDDEVLNTSHCSDSIDHLVGAAEQRWRQFKSERRGGLQIDRQLVCGRRLTGRSAAFSPLRMRST